jgi:hypothetical protein
MIDRMGSPFRYRKKERKRLRRRAKKETLAAEKFEAEGVEPFAALSRRMADRSLKLARIKRRKKSKPKNPV